MRNKTIAMMLTLATAPTTGFAKTQDCPGLECAKRVGADDEQGTTLLEVDTLFKCHGDPESFDGAMAGLAGDLNGHSRRAFGIVTFGDDGYFAYVKAPYRVSAPVFFVQDETSYACVTVQHSRNKCHAKSEPELDVDVVEVNVEVDEELEEVQAPDDIAEWPSRLLQANFDAADEAADKEDETAGYRKPQAPAPGNSPADLPEAKGRDPKDLPMQSGNVGLREPKAPPIGNQPAGMPEGKDVDIKDMPMQQGNLGLREPKAPPIGNQPAGMPEAKGMNFEDLPMQSGNIGLREPQAPPRENQPNPEGTKDNKDTRDTKAPQETQDAKEVKDDK